jgi:hypothetical protein
MSVRINRDQAKALGIEAPPRTNKYHAVRTEYNGRWYDSKMEAEHALRLDNECLQGSSVRLYSYWIPQVRFELGSARIVYRADFLVFLGWPCDRHHEFAVEVHEVKGRRTERFKIITRLWAKHGPFPMLIFNSGKLEETIIPKEYNG